MPLLQIVFESTIFRPCVKSIRKNGCDPLQMLGVAILLVLKLPKQIKALFALTTGQQPRSNDGVDEEKAIAGASAV